MTSIEFNVRNMVDNKIYQVKFINQETNEYETIIIDDYRVVRKIEQLANGMEHEYMYLDGDNLVIDEVEFPLDYVVIKYRSNRTKKNIERSVANLTIDQLYNFILKYVFDN